MKTTIYSQHYEHTEWLNKLSFYVDEISVMQKRIEEIAQKNTAKEVKIKIEHFQNQLLIQKNNIDALKRHIKDDEKLLKDNIMKNETAVDHRKIEDHIAEREDIEVFETNFNHLRKEFNLFLAEWM
ncbi:MAG TPA: hypothetical protein VNX01_10685 [Bacteroidia bacterium]|jgi:hypothetical protein|nr:hypothetical protein [Bacteroidia bacterium]